MSVYPLVNKGAYAQVDPVLSSWALERGVHWFAEYQDYEVRTFFVGEGRQRAQVAVDPPASGLVAVHVGQALGRGRANKFDPPPCSIAELPSVLDEALRRATEWVGPT
jgi:hypothetical protein